MLFTRVNAGQME